jgi:hypothetical protein
VAKCPHSTTAVPPAAFSLAASSSASSFTSPLATTLGAPSTSSFDCEARYKEE